MDWTGTFKNQGAGEGGRGNGFIGREGKRRLKRDRAELRVENVHLRTEMLVSLCQTLVREAHTAARQLTTASVLSGNQPTHSSFSPLPPALLSPPVDLLHTQRPQAAPVTFCLFRRVQFFQSRSWICLTTPMLVTAGDQLTQSPPQMAKAHGKPQT